MFILLKNLLKVKTMFVISAAMIRRNAAVIIKTVDEQCSVQNVAKR